MSLINPHSSELVWEPIFQNWAKPSSENEKEKCSNAERMIRDAITKHHSLQYKAIEVFAQGSNANNTNVKNSSDVDICVICKDIINPNYSFANGLNDVSVGLIDATYTYNDFKADVTEALRTKFGKDNVILGNKAIDIKPNSYRVEADVVPCIEHRRYDANGSYSSGIWFKSQSGQSITGWPKQHLENGKDKNLLTGRRYKKVVRILKRLKMAMLENRTAEAGNISSFQIECLIWNVPNHLFNQNTLLEDVKQVLSFLIVKTAKDDDCREWGEVNEHKYLFNRQRLAEERMLAHAFLWSVWQYLGFKI